MMYVELMKNIHLADSNEVMVVRLIWDSEPKNVSLLLSRHDVGRVHEKFSPGLLERGLAVKRIFRPTER